MTILTILLFISCILFLIGYRKEMSRRIALEGEVKSLISDEEDLNHAAISGVMNKLFQENEGSLNRTAQMLTLPKTNRGYKPKAMTAPIVKKETSQDSDGHVWAASKEHLSPITHKELEPIKPKIPRGYKRHDGGKCPLKPNQKAFAFFRDGTKSQTQQKSAYWEWQWCFNARHGDNLLAYKVVKPKTMKRNKK